MTHHTHYSSHRHSLESNKHQLAVLSAKEEVSPIRSLGSKEEQEIINTRSASTYKQESMPNVLATLSPSGTTPCEPQRRGAMSLAPIATHPPFHLQTR